MSTLVAPSLGAQVLHSHEAFSQGSQNSQPIATTFGGGKLRLDAMQEESQRENRSNTASLNADDQDGQNDASKKRKYDEECPEEFMTQKSQEYANSQHSLSPAEEDELMNVEEHKELYLHHLSSAVSSGWARDDLEDAFDPLFSYFAGKLQDRKEQQRIVGGLIFIIIDGKIPTAQGLVAWGANRKDASFFERARDQGLEAEVKKIIESIPDIFAPATPAANGRSEVVSETPSSQPLPTPKASPSRNLRTEMSPAVGAQEKRAGSAVVERSPAREASASQGVDAGFPTEREVARHVEKAEEIQDSVSSLKIKRRRLLQQVEHVRGMEQGRREAEKAMQTAVASAEKSRLKLEEARRALAEAEAAAVAAEKQEREEREEAQVAKLRAEQAGADCRHARAQMEDGKRDFEQILGRLRRTVAPDGSQPKDK